MGLSILLCLRLQVFFMGQVAMGSVNSGYIKTQRLLIIVWLGMCCWGGGRFSLQGCADLAISLCLRMLFLGQKCCRIMILLLYLSSRKMISLFYKIAIIQYHQISMFDQSTRLCDVKYKIVFLGHSAVGKSALIERFIHNSFDYGKNETIGIDFLVKNITYQGAVYRLQLWDTAGQEKFKSLVPNYIKDAHCAVFAYDITRPETFEGVDSWIQLFNEHHSGNAVGILVGNKNDLQQKRAVTQQQGQSKASKLSISFCQTSACSGRGVEQLFHSIIQNIEVSSKTLSCQGEQQSQNTGSTFSSSINKRKIVKISQEKAQQMACCYI